MGIPWGWKQVRSGKVKKGDWIKSGDGWVNAENIGPSVVTKSGILSAIGHPVALYECVIRSVVKRKNASPYDRL